MRTAASRTVRNNPGIRPILNVGQQSGKMYDYTIDLPDGRRLTVSVADDSWQWSDADAAVEPDDDVARCRLRYLEYSWRVVEHNAA